MGKNKKILILLAAFVILYMTGRLVFPLAIFLAVAPLIALKDFEHQLKFKFIDFTVLFALVIATLTTAMLEGNNILYAAMYSLLIWLAFVFYGFTSKNLNNNIGVFTILIFWLALEYTALKISPQTAPFLLGNAIDSPALIPWSGYSGMIGVSCWILSGNLLFYYVFFKGENNILEGNIRWLSLSYSIIIIAMPVIISSFIDFEMKVITAQTVENLYSGSHVAISPYAENGEFFGRTAAWVSSLIVIYAFVKRKIR